MDNKTSSDCSNKNPLSQNNVKELVQLYKTTKDEYVLEEIINRNKDLIYSIIWKYYRYYAETEMSVFTVEDLYQEGIFGIIRAIEKFDFSYDTEFSTYVYMWIKSYVGRFIANASLPLSYSVNKQEKILTTKLVINEFFMKNGRNPTLDELKLLIPDKPEKFYKDMQSYLNVSVCSITEPIADKDDMTLNEVIPDKKDTETEIINKLLVTQYMSILDEREKMIIKCRFFDLMTHKELSNILNISKSRVQQLEAKAIKKMRDYDKINFQHKLKKYMP